MQSLKNTIDFIYLINLDERFEKWEKCHSQFKHFGIAPYRFSAINGWNLSLKTINEMGLKFMPGMRGNRIAAHYSTSHTPEFKFLVASNYGKTFFHRLMRPGAMGCTLSHLSVLQDAWERCYKTISGEEGWDILYTDHDKADQHFYACHNDFESDLKGIDLWSPDLSIDPSHLKRREIVDDEFIKIGMRYRTHSMVIRRRGIKKILDYKKCHSIYNAYDVEIAFVPGIKMYMLRHNLVTFSEGVSDTCKNYFSS
jgi:hypothetical protein